MESTLVWTLEDDELYGVKWDTQERATIMTCGCCNKQFERYINLIGMSNNCPHCGKLNTYVRC